MTDQNAHAIANLNGASIDNFNIGSGAPARRAPLDLPPAPEQHFGRHAQLALLVERLRAGRNTAVVGPAGLGKTALAAQAVRTVVGTTHAALAASPFPDGVVLLDLYTLSAALDPVLNALANQLRGGGFMRDSPALERATEACHALRMLLIIEGGEEADGHDGRAAINQVLRVLPATSTWLLLTRLSIQATAAQSVTLKEALNPQDATALFDALNGRRVGGVLRDEVLSLLDGHPLALTWAANLLAGEDEDPGQLVAAWRADGLPALRDPTQAERTLAWLFGRSARHLDDTALQVLTAAGLLAHAPFPTSAIDALGVAANVIDILKVLVQRGLMRRSCEDDSWQFTHVLGYRFARQGAPAYPALREKLGVWLSRELDARLAGGLADGGDALASTLGHMAAVPGADDAQSISLAHNMLYDVVDRLTALGRLDLVQQALDAVEGWMKCVPAAPVGESDWIPVRWALSLEQGDLLRAQGDLAGALTSYQAMVAICGVLSKANSINTAWRRNLSVSHGKIGDILWAQGNLIGAMASYQEALSISRDLSAADPTNTTWLRDLSVSHSKIADIIRDQGDLAGALTSYQAALSIRRDLSAADPADTQWRRDLSVSHDKIGDILTVQGDLAGAMTSYQAALGIDRVLSAADPTNTGRRRDLSVSHSKIGDILCAQGDLVGALTSYQAALSIRRDLSVADPTNTGWRRDLSVGHSRIGKILSAQGDLAGAMTSHQAALSIRRDLSAADPTNTGWRRDLSYSLTVMAQVHAKQGKKADALLCARESLSIDEELARLDATNATWQKDVAISRRLVDWCETDLE